MFETDTPVVLTDGRDGIIKNKRKVPRSEPTAWEYQVQLTNGRVEWVGRYDVKKKAQGDRLTEEASRFRTDKLASQFRWSEQDEFPVELFLPLWGSRAKVREWWDSEQLKRDDAALYDWVRAGGPLRAGNPIYVTLNDDGSVQSLWDGWHRVGAALLSNTEHLFAVVGKKLKLR